jgi:hypothetical protein
MTGRCRPPLYQPTIGGPKDPRNSAGPVPELGYSGSGVRHQTAAGHGDVQSHDPLRRGWNRAPQRRQNGGLGQTGRDIQSLLAASYRLFPTRVQLASGPDIGIGGGGLGTIAATVRVCFAFTIWIGALVRVQLKLAQLIAAGTSICSASSVMATNIVANTHDEDFANAIACVIVLSVTMFAYPITAHAKAWTVAATTFLSIASAATDHESNVRKSEGE